MLFAPPSNRSYNRSVMKESAEAARPKGQALGLMTESAEAARPRGQALGLMKMSAETAPPKGPFDH